MFGTLWGTVNQIRIACAQISYKHEQWFNHFKDLLNIDANVANDFTVHVIDEHNI